VRKKPKRWEVIRIRAKGEFLGFVYAKGQEDARKEATKTFAMRAGEERWLIIRSA
jgi:hypothetical protein